MKTILQQICDDGIWVECDFCGHKSDKQKVGSLCSSCFGGKRRKIIERRAKLHKVTLGDGRVLYLGME